MRKAGKAENERESLLRPSNMAGRPWPAAANSADGPCRAVAEAWGPRLDESSEMTLTAPWADCFQPAAAPLGLAERLELLLRVSETAAWEALHPAITWPIETTKIVDVFNRKSV